MSNQTYWDYFQEANKILNHRQINKKLLAHYFNQNLNWLYSNFHLPVPDNKSLENYLKLITKYQKGYPLAYLINQSWFCGFPFYVDERVLIPRAETEELINQTNTLISELFSKDSQLKILDLGTGSGCIAVSLQNKFPFASIIASDISQDALVVAQKNAKLLNKTNINFVQSDVFSNLNSEKFSVIISNPPYINELSDTYDQKNLQYEPNLALFASNQGYKIYEQILATVKPKLNENFLLAFEFGFDQKEQLETMVKNFCTEKMTFHFTKDFNHHWRYLFIYKKNKS